MLTKETLLSKKVNGRRHSKLFTNCHVSWDTLYPKVSLIAAVAVAQGSNVRMPR